MSAIIKGYLTDYYEEVTLDSIKRKCPTEVNRIVLALIDIDTAIKNLQPKHSEKEWEAFTLFLHGYSYRDIGEETGIWIIDKLFNRICREIAREAGRQYLDTYLLNIILFELKAIERRERGYTKKIKLEKEEKDFIFRKFNMTEKEREGSYAHVTIFNFAYTAFGGLGAGCIICGKVTRRYDYCPHFRLIKKEYDYDRLEQI